MTDTQIATILLVEDDEVDAEVMRRALFRGPHKRFSLRVVPSLHEAFETLLKERYQLVILDLSLPDSRGLATLRDFKAREPDVAVVVMTGQDDDRLALEALRLGAQDYVPKGAFDSNLLQRVIRYSLERHRLLFEVEGARQGEQRERELRLLERVERGQDSQSPGASGRRGGGPPLLSDSAPTVFKHMVREYERLIDIALEKRFFHTGTSSESVTLVGLARELGRVHAGPRDVVEIHRRALRNRLQGQIPARSQAILEEGRLIVLEFMGHLAAHYREVNARLGKESQGEVIEGLLSSGG